MSKEFLVSILICTLESRRESFDYIYNKLDEQIKECNMQDDVEILFFRDNGEHPVGYKRNELLRKSKAKYTCYVDDDDDVSEDYVPLIFDGLKYHQPDCIGLAGEITWSGRNPKKFVHSIRYDSYFERRGVYYRPPNHLNPIKRSIAKQFPFQEINVGEDSDWAMRICKSGKLKKEHFIEKIMYHYLFDARKSKTQKR